MTGDGGRSGSAERGREPRRRPRSDPGRGRAARRRARRHAPAGGAASLDLRRLGRRPRVPRGGPARSPLGLRLLRAARRRLQDDRLPLPARPRGAGPPLLHAVRVLPGVQGGQPLGLHRHLHELLLQQAPRRGTRRRGDPPAAATRGAQPRPPRRPRRAPARGRRAGPGVRDGAPLRAGEDGRPEGQGGGREVRLPGADQAGAEAGRPLRLLPPPQAALLPRLQRRR